MVIGLSQAAPARSSTGEMGFLGLETPWALGSVAGKVMETYGKGNITYLVGGFKVVPPR